MIEAHDLIDKIENDFKEDMNTQVTIHIDLVIVGDKKIEKMKSKVLVILKELNKNIEIHDFRLIEGKIKTKILFDCVLPFEVDYSYKELKELLNNNGKTTKNMIQFCFPIQNSETRIKSMIQMFKKGIYGKNPMVDVEIECNSNYIYYSFLILFILFLYI
jgi:hypothetical protein